MINSGIIRNIEENHILVEPYNSQAGSDASCSSGSCKNCAHYVKKRLIKVENRADMALSSGLTVEFELSSTYALLSFARLFLLPLSLYLGFYFIGKSLQGEVLTGIITGAMGVSLAILFNYFSMERFKGKEIPRIIKILY